jgi:hypothetical protein
MSEQVPNGVVCLECYLEFCLPNTFVMYDVSLPM